jgi:hypothetical protein
MGATHIQPGHLQPDLQTDLQTRRMSSYNFEPVSLPVSRVRNPFHYRHDKELSELGNIRSVL